MQKAIIECANTLQCHDGIPISNVHCNYESSSIYGTEKINAAPNQACLVQGIFILTLTHGGRHSNLLDTGNLCLALLSTVQEIFSKGFEDIGKMRDHILPELKIPQPLPGFIAFPHCSPCDL